MSLVGKDRLEALEELKALNSKELVELRHEHDEILTTLRDTRAEMALSSGQLNTLLLEKDSLAKRHADNLDILVDRERAISDLRATCAALEGSSDGRDAALEKRVVQLQNKCEDLREKAFKMREFVKRQNKDIERLKNGEDRKAEEVGRERGEREEERRREMELVERENRLMTGAWYGLSSRLQMNSVVLVRKSEPKGWLGKMRAEIHGPVVGFPFWILRWGEGGEWWWAFVLMACLIRRSKGGGLVKGEGV